MTVEITKVFTADDSGGPFKTFRGGGEIGFQIHFDASDISENEPIEVTFHVRRLYAFNPRGDGSVDDAFTPEVIWSKTFELESEGVFVAHTTWRIPDSDPLLEIGGLSDVWNEPWRVLGGRGEWELTGLVSERTGDMDNNRERWLYRIVG